MLEFFLVIFAMGLALLGLGVFYRYGLGKRHSGIDKMETLVDKTVPYALVLLMIIIAIEVFFKDFAHQYHSYLIAMDYAVISVFVVDLGFKYIHSRTNTGFVKKNWLDIIAVFPFIIMFRVFEELILLARIERGVGEAQAVLHTGVGIEKEVSKAARLEKEVLAGSKFSRTAKFARELRIISRFPRLAKAVSFYEHPNHRKR